VHGQTSPVMKLSSNVIVSFGAPVVAHHLPDVRLALRHQIEDSGCCIDSAHLTIVVVLDLISDSWIQDHKVIHFQRFATLAECYNPASEGVFEAFRFGHYYHAVRARVSPHWLND